VAVTPIGFFGFLGTMAWVLVVSVLWVMRKGTDAGAPAADRPTATTM
jgi:hypothetical protein